MKKLTYKSGNLLLATDVVAIGHQANCQNTFGSGIARSIREMYPEAYAADTEATTKNHNTLGSISVGEIQWLSHVVWQDGSGAMRNAHNSSIRRIYNLYGQNLYGRAVRQTNYDALYNALEKMAKHLRESTINDVPVGFPYKMGSDRGGGSWDIVSRLIEVAFDGYEGDVVIYKFDAPVP